METAKEALGIFSLISNKALLQKSEGNWPEGSKSIIHLFLIRTQQRNQRETCQEAPGTFSRCFF